MGRSQLETKYLKTKLRPTSNYTKGVKTFVVRYAKAKEENIMSP